MEKKNEKEEIPYYLRKRPNTWFESFFRFYLKRFN